MPSWQRSRLDNLRLVASILKHGLDRAFAHDAAPDDPPLRHGNIRGSGYYH